MAKKPLQTGIKLETKDLLDNITVQTNISQEIIVVSADKAKLCLIHYKDILKSQTDWMAPAGILISLVTSLFATDFKNFLGIQAEVWRAIYILLSIVTSIWFLITLSRAYKNRNKGDIEELIKMLKNSNN